MKKLTDSVMTITIQLENFGYSVEVVISCWLGIGECSFGSGFFMQVGGIVAVLVMKIGGEVKGFCYVCYIVLSFYG